MSKREELKQENEFLDSLVKDIDLTGNTKSGVFAKNEIKSYIDYDGLKKECLESAENKIQSIIDFYIHDDLVEQQYLEEKRKTDILKYFSMLWEVKSARLAIQQLQEEIAAGNTAAKNFEVLARLQMSFNDIMKSFIATESLIERGYQDAKSEFKIQNYENENNIEKRLQKNKTGSLQGFSHTNLLQSLNEGNE